eukprot:6198377-Pleurochrysis_carterae.AAC.2
MIAWRKAPAASINDSIPPPRTRTKETNTETVSVHSGWTQTTGYMVPGGNTVLLNTFAQTVESEEEQCRRWARQHGFYLGKSSVLLATFFNHFAACARRPAGTADGKMGSQQC